jgi:hypothetical protein
VSARRRSRLPGRPHPSNRGAGSWAYPTTDGGGRHGSLSPFHPLRTGRRGTRCCFHSRRRCRTYIASMELAQMASRTPSAAAARRIRAGSKSLPASSSDLRHGEAVGRRLPASIRGVDGHRRVWMRWMGWQSAFRLSCAHSSRLPPSDCRRTRTATSRSESSRNASLSKASRSTASV